jgi:tetratricopeptide (TPR) repeat protein
VLHLADDDRDELTPAPAAAVAALPAAPPAASAAPAAAPQTGVIELDLDDVFVLDLDDDEVPASLVQPPPDVAADSRGGAFEVEPPPELDDVAFDWDEAGTGLEAQSQAADAEAEVELEAPEAGPQAAEPVEEPEPQPLELGLDIDADFLEKTAAELQPPPVRSADDLFTEAEVLAKYSLEDKAYERLQDVLRLEPGHLEAMALTIRIDLHKRRFTHAAWLAESMAATARERGELTGWRKVRNRMASAGFGFDGDRVVEVPEPAPDTAELQVGRMLQGLLERPRRPAAGRPAAGDGGRVDARIAEIAAEILAPGRRTRKPAPAVPPPEPEPGETAEAAAEAVEPIAAPPPPEAAELAAEQALPEDSGVTWLDEVEQVAEDRPQAVAPPDADFVAEDEFFDLAAELEQELAAEARQDGDEVHDTPREQSLEEIVEGFKRGVAENLSDEDYDTHFNLGIAYREMGLIDEAIGEFQLAAKDPGRLVECCSMLGLCFLDKGLPELSVKWYRRGLAAPALSEDDALGLLYDLGNVHLAVSDLEAAHEVFVEVYGTNSNYRDVVAKLEEIGSRRG